MDGQIRALLCIRCLQVPVNLFKEFLKLLEKSFLAANVQLFTGVELIAFLQSSLMI
jgi:hypothetical protein